MNNPMIVQGAPSYSVLHQTLLEALVSQHFEKAFAVFNTYVDDPALCLALTDELFRTVSNEGRLSPAAVYGALADRIRALPAQEAMLDDVQPEHFLCWLIKETAQLSYDELAHAMGMEREQVKHALAAVRFALLEQL